jgi:hypothetical protein
MNLNNLTSSMRLCLAALSLCLLQGTSSSAGILFSYDASAGQLPTDQGWNAFDIDTVGPLTAPSGSGTTPVNANAAMETFAGDSLGVLHLRDTLTDGPGDLPTFYYSWTTQQQNALVNRGLKFTMIFKGLRTTQSGKGNVRFGFNGTVFETSGFSNIPPDRTYEVLGLSNELAPLDDLLHTLVVEGEQLGSDYVFTATLDGTVLGSTLARLATNPASVPLESNVYFGANSSPGRGADILVRSVVMETLNVPEPSTFVMVACGALFLVGSKQRRV